MPSARKQTNRGNKSKKKNPRKIMLKNNKMGIRRKVKS